MPRAEPSDRTEITRGDLATQISNTILRWKTPTCGAQPFVVGGYKVILEIVSRHINHSVPLKLIWSFILGNVGTAEGLSD